MTDQETDTLRQMTPAQKLAVMHALIRQAFAAALRTLATPALVSLVLALLVLLPRAATAQAAPLTGLDDYVTAAMEAWGIPGLALAVVRDDSVIFARGYGVREMGKPGAVDVNTLFNIASTSKAFTVAALGMLVDEGKLSWDDHVTDHMPGFQLQDPYVTREIRVRDLLTHRAGVARDDNLWIAGPFARDELLRRLRHLPQVAGFRERYGYNNLMFITAGEVAGGVSGTRWDDFVSRRIFGPLGMTRSTTRMADVLTRDNVSGSHARIDGVVQPVPRRNYDLIGGAGSIWSSVNDMSRWVRLQLGHGTFEGTRLISDAAIDEMRTPQMLIPIDSVGRRLFPDRHLNSYGLGWDVEDYRGRILVNHSGWLNNTRTQVGLIPSEGIGFVAIANLNVSTLQQALMYRVLDALLGEAPVDWSALYLELDRRSQDRAARSRETLEAARLAGTTPSLPLDGYTGTFESDLWGTMTVTLEGDGLVLRYAPEFVSDLEHWHDDVFRARWRTAGDGSSFVTFTLDERARITAMEVEDFGSYRAR
jgi:CubicO group peptidase (beta-lactamase class C family)